MMNPTWHNVNPHFKLNGLHYNLEDLHEVGYSLIKEGEPFEISMGDFLLDWVSPKPTLEVMTSGSTGKPKKIELEKEHMVNSALATGEHFDLNPDDTALLCLPCTGIAGKMMLVRAMVLGLHLDYVEPSSSLLWDKKHYDFVAMVPLQVQNSLERLPQVKTLIVGGAPMETSLKSKLTDLSTEVYETYGMTETITHIATKRINGAGSKEKENPFKTLPNISISRDNRDCLVIDAPKISHNKIVTNDIVEVLDKAHFEWLGRYDSVINSGGVKLIPEQIEKKLSPIIPSRFFVAGLPDESLGQKLVLIVEDSKCDKERLLQEIEVLKEISTYEIPKQLFCLPSFEETENGKIQRKKTIRQLG